MSFNRGETVVSPRSEGNRPLQWMEYDQKQQLITEFIHFERSRHGIEATPVNTATTVIEHISTTNIWSFTANPPLFNHLCSFAANARESTMSEPLDDTIKVTRDTPGIFTANIKIILNKNNANIIINTWGTGANRFTPRNKPEAVLMLKVYKKAGKSPLEVPQEAWNISGLNSWPDGKEDTRQVYSPAAISNSRNKAEKVGREYDIEANENGVHCLIGNIAAQANMREVEKANSVNPPTLDPSTDDPMSTATLEQQLAICRTALHSQMELKRLWEQRAREHHYSALMWQAYALIPADANDNTAPIRLSTNLANPVFPPFHTEEGREDIPVAPRVLHQSTPKKRPRFEMN